MATGTTTRPLERTTTDPARVTARQGGGLGSILVGVSWVIALAVAWRLYQQAFAFSKGLDSTSPEFTQYWVSFFAVNMIGLPLLAVIWYAYLWFSGQRMTHEPADEPKRLWNLWVLLLSLTVTVFVAIHFGEQDAAWHQVTVRDTAFTPSHDVLFYGSFPLIIYLSTGIYLYARTRLPHMYGGRSLPISFVLIVVGGGLLLFQVAMNEFGHSFWQTEERFGDYLHWPFIIFGYMLAAIFAVFFETLPRIIELARQEQAEEEKTAAQLQPASPSAAH